MIPSRYHGMSDIKRHREVSLSVCLCDSGWLSDSLSLCLSVSVSVCLFMSVCLSACLYVSLSDISILHVLFYRYRLTVQSILKKFVKTPDMRRRWRRHINISLSRLLILCFKTRGVHQ